MVAAAGFVVFLLAAGFDDRVLQVEVGYVSARWCCAGCCTRCTATRVVVDGDMAKHPAVGEEAPDFELEGTDGTFRLSEHRGERVLLLFYPGDETTVCTKQFCSYRDNAEAFGALGVTAVGISGKDVDSKKRFADNHELNVPLLADPDVSVAKAYDAYAAAEGDQARRDHHRRAGQGRPPPRPRARAGLPDGRGPEEDAGLAARAGVGSLRSERPPHISAPVPSARPPAASRSSWTAATSSRSAATTEDVFSNGFLCPKATGLKHLSDDPDRLRTPLVRGADGELRGGHLGRGVPR